MAQVRPIGEGARRAHDEALGRGELTYADPTTGYLVFTEHYLLDRAFCCGNGCRHCPY